MKNFFLLFSTVLLLGMFACDNIQTNGPVASSKMGTADEMSAKLADSILIASGGREAWENTEYVKWNFFGNRRHVWNKKTNEVIIEGLKEKYKIRVNLNTLTGKVNYGGVDYVQQDTLKKYLTMGRDMWRNDSYWVFLPFKLRDPGVNLKYLGQKPFRTFEACHQIEMTFDGVGKTPQNRYIITIHPRTNNILHWDYFANASDTQSKMSTPWHMYEKYGDIYLGSFRGENYMITEMEVGPQLASYFE